jgi:hypothetical protein
VIWTALTAWAASPVPSPTPGVDDELVTPGVWGFAITLAVMIAVVLLVLDMTRRIRRVNYRAQVREQLAAEELAAAAAEAAKKKS